MSMQITERGPVAGKPAETGGTLPSRASNRQQRESATAAAAGHRNAILAIHPDLGRFASADERLNALAADARTADRRVAVASETMGRMKEELEKITKNYPPFPPGSEERVRVLKSYAALRRQIAQMTVPPEQDVSVPEREEPKERAAIYTFVLQTDGRVQAVPRSDVHVGPSGVVIPEVQPSATDREIREAIAVLEGNAQGLRDLRARMAAETLAGAVTELAERKGPVLGQMAVEQGEQDPEETVQAVSHRIMNDLGNVDGGLLHTPELRASLTGVASWR